MSHYNKQDETHAAEELATLRHRPIVSSSSQNLIPTSGNHASSPIPHQIVDKDAITLHQSLLKTSESSPNPTPVAKKPTKASKKNTKSQQPLNPHSMGSDFVTPAQTASPKVAGTTTEEGEAKSRKRRRVVVACDTCRRKKVKCEGLPNLTNACNNCSVYNYRCTFTSEPDRSRGKYEILESKVETLLSALRSVAPHVADQFERGELNITGPSGGSAPPQNATAWRELYQSSAAPNEAESDELDNQSSAPHASHQSRTTLNEVTGGDQIGSSSVFDSGAIDSDHLSHSALAKPDSLADTKREERDSLLPDIEEGRPRYFGRSSAMTLFHSMQGGNESRPPSPDPGSKSQHLASHPQASNRVDRQHLHDTSSKPLRKSEMDSFHPSNRANKWIMLLRRKNTVAVGRDDPYTEEWFERYTLPANDLVKDLLDLFFDKLHPLMPIVHQPSLERDLESGRAEEDTAFRGFVFTILAIASRFSNDPRVWSDPSDPDTAGDHFAAASRLYHQVHAASLINVQVLILTATFMHGAIGPSTGWTVLGVAIRALQDIGLHQERAYKDYTPFDQEIRRRVFWGAFILDTMFSAYMGRPSALRLSDCDVRLPLEVDDDALFQVERGGPIPLDKPNKPIAMSGFIYMIKLNMIVQDVVHTLYHPRWRQEIGSRKVPLGYKYRAMPEYKHMAILSKRLEEWVAGTPDHLKSLDSPFKLQAGLVQCGTHDIKLYILKPFLDHAALRKMLYSQCIHHARKGLKTVLELYEGGHIVDLFFIFQQAFMSTATFMITVWHECREAEKLAEDNDLIEATLRTFCSFGDRFFSKMFRRAHRILRDIAAKAIHTMNPDQRERVGRMLQSRISSGVRTIVSVSTTGANQLPPISQGDTMIPVQPPNGAPCWPNDPTGRRRVSVDAPVIKVGAGQANLYRDPEATESYTSPTQWSPTDYNSSPQPRATYEHFYGASHLHGAASLRSPVSGAEQQHGLVHHNMLPSMPVEQTLPTPTSQVDGLERHNTQPGTSGDAQNILPFQNPAAEDVGSLQNQLDEFTWTDYFAKFLDEIGTGSQTESVGSSSSLAAPIGMEYAMGSPFSSSSSLMAQNPRRMG